jgi:hypothetical protein
MVIPGRILLAATIVTSLTMATSKRPDLLDDQWASKALSGGAYDEGWSQPCQDEWSRGNEIHCDVREFPYRVDGPIAIDGGLHGGITVMGWEREEVRVLYRVKARAVTIEQAKELAGQVRLELAKGWLRPEGPPQAGNRQSWSVEMKVWAPRKSDLSLRAHNGPAAVRGLHGTMELHSLNGPVSLVDLSGAVLARVTNGPLEVILGGRRWTGAGLDAEAQNGPVRLELPKDYSARLVTGTRHGPTDLDYPMKSLVAIGRGHFSTTLGSGGPTVRVVTSNGPYRFTTREGE